MNISDWVKPAVLAIAAGGVAATIIGFSWGGWVTTSKAEAMADDFARAEVVSALIPFCVEKSVADPDREATLIKLKEASSYKRADIVMEANWAQMPGATSTDRNLAGACAEKIVEDL